MRGRPDSTGDVVAWLRAMPAADRERVARLLTDPAAVAAVRAERAAAVVEMLAEPGSSWQSVADRMGVGTSVVNRMVTAHNKATASAPE